MRHLRGPLAPGERLGEPRANRGPTSRLACRPRPREVPANARAAATARARRLPPCPGRKAVWLPSRGHRRPLTRESGGDTPARSTRCAAQPGGTDSLTAPVRLAHRGIHSLSTAGTASPAGHPTPGNHGQPAGRRSMRSSRSSSAAATSSGDPSGRGTASTGVGASSSRSVTFSSAIFRACESTVRSREPTVEL